MRIMLSLVRDPPVQGGPRVYQPISAIRLSVWEDGELKAQQITLGLDPAEKKKSLQAVADTLARSDVIPVGWDLRRDVWPSLCLLFVQYGCKFPKLMPLSKKWNEQYLCDLCTMVSQGGYDIDMSEKMTIDYVLGGGNPNYKDDIETEHMYLWMMFNKYSESLNE